MLANFRMVFSTRSEFTITYFAATCVAATTFSLSRYLASPQGSRQ
jgi:hypothetical protein